MMIFDMLMKPVDSYWKQRFHAEEIKRRAAEADAKYYKYQADDTQEKLHVLSERDIGQYHAIEVLNRKISEQQQIIEQMDRDLGMARELLAAERRASKAYQLSERLWEERRERIATAPSGLRNDTVPGNEKEAQ